MRCPAGATDYKPPLRRSGLLVPWVAQAGGMLFPGAEGDYLEVRVPTVPLLMKPFCR